MNTEQPTSEKIDWMYEDERKALIRSYEDDLIQLRRQLEDGLNTIWGKFVDRYPEWAKAKFH